LRLQAIGTDRSLGRAGRPVSRRVSFGPPGCSDPGPSPRPVFQSAERRRCFAELIPIHLVSAAAAEKHDSTSGRLFMMSWQARS